MTITQSTMDSPLGTLLITVEDDLVTRAEFVADSDLPAGIEAAPASPVLREAEQQFAAYFAGDLREFDLPMAPRGTVFQRRVWGQLREIPYGVTTSYGEIARRLGMKPGASRAVGTANGANPIAIAVPCHRVIGSSGRLIGYAGGLPRKRFLLGLEAPDLLFRD